MQSLAERIGKGALAEVKTSPGDSILVQFDQSEDGWIVQDPLIGILKTSGLHAYAHAPAGSSSGIGLSVSGIQLEVRYDDMFREGFLGTKKVRRTVGVSFSCRMTAIATSEVLFSRSMSENAVDTVAVDDIRNLESTDAKATHADLPSEMFIDRILEPIVIIGATGVAVYLFFHIRS